MAEPLSIKCEPWSDFSRQGYSFITDDFCHEKNFVAKIAAKSARSVIKIKETLNSKAGKLSVADEVKLWFDLPNNGSFYTKIKSTDYIKIHYDNGVKEWNGNKYFLYGTLNSNKTFNRFSAKAGVGSFSGKVETDNRLKFTLQQDKQNLWHWYHKTLVNQNKYKFGFLAVYDIGARILQKNNFLFGYKLDEKSQFFLRTQIKGFRTSIPKLSNIDEVFDVLTADFIRKIDSDSKAGIEVAYSFKTKNLSHAHLVYEKTIKKVQKVKVSLNNHLDLAIVHKRPIYGLQNLANISIGVGITGIKQKDVKFNSGFEVNVNL